MPKKRSITKPATEAHIIQRIKGKEVITTFQPLAPFMVARMSQSDQSVQALALDESSKADQPQPSKVDPTHDLP
jgi:hypothetical protein